MAADQRVSARLTCYGNRAYFGELARVVVGDELAAV